MKKIALISTATSILLSLVFSFAAQGERLTQGQFAVTLIKSMKLDNQLPLAPLQEDAILVLDSLGICPLSGWDKNAYLSEEDYTVLVAKTMGKEKLVFTKATEVCQKTSKIISNRWHNKYQSTHHYDRLPDFLKDKSYFPEQAECPYGLPYEDKDGNHEVDTHYHPFISEFISH